VQALTVSQTMTEHMTALVLAMFGKQYDSLQTGSRERIPAVGSMRRFLAGDMRSYVVPIS